MIPRFSDFLAVGWQPRQCVKPLGAAPLIGAPETAVNGRFRQILSPFILRNKTARVNREVDFVDVSFLRSGD
jgi:hypothetical protein